MRSFVICRIRIATLSRYRDIVFETAEFMASYEEALSRTSAPHAPWYIIPADHKWYRDLAVAGIVLAALRGMGPHIPKPKLDVRRFKL